MPRRTAAAVAPKDELPPEELFDEELAPYPAPKSKFEDDLMAFIAGLKQNVRDKSSVYIYRTFPKIKKKPGMKKYIQVYPARMFSYDELFEDEGGGKFKIEVDIGDGQRHVFYHEDPRPAIIHPDYILVDDNGNPIPPPAPPATAALVTKDDIPAIIAGATAAAKTGNDAQQEALNASVQLITTAASKSLEIVADSIKKNAGGDSQSNAAITALAARFDSLEASLKDQRIANLEKQLVELKEQRANPAPASAPSEVAAVAETAKLFGIDGGFTGVVKALSGADAKEEGFLDYLGKGLGDGLKDVLRDWGGNLIQLGREYIHLRHIEALQKQKPGAPAPPVPQPQPRPQAPALDQPQQPQPTQEEFVLNVTREITKTIRYYLERNFDGAGVAEIVKDKFRDLMPFVTTLDIFKDFNKMMEFCRQNDDLKEFVNVPEFTQFAREFWDEFQPDPAPIPEPAAQQQKPN